MITKADNIHTRVKVCIINSLELEMTPEDIPDDAPLFDPCEDGGLELDSLAALEIVVALCQEFNIQLTDANPEAFATIDTLANLVAIEIKGTED